MAVPSGTRDWPQANKGISPMQLEKNWFAAQLRRPHNEHDTDLPPPEWGKEPAVLRSEQGLHIFEHQEQMKGIRRTRLKLP